MRSLLGVSIAAALALFACKSGGTDKTKPVDNPPATTQSFIVDLTGYDLSCATDADCEIVKDYPCETRCSCPQKPISKKSMARYQAAVAAIDCTKAPKDDQSIVCGECMSPLPSCNAGTCTTKNPP